MAIESSRFDELREVLYSGVIADVLDEKGVRNNAMEYGIRPLKDDMKVFGRAFTVLATDVYEVPEEPYKLELESVDGVGSDDILVATTNGSTSSGFWGELLTTTAMKHGCKGAVISGHTRDARKILQMDFSLFVTGFCPYDSKGRTDVIAYGVPIVCNGVSVKPGDLIFGDIDGIVVIPQEIEDEIIDMALDKINKEDIARDYINSGKSATDMYKKFGVL